MKITFIETALRFFKKLPKPFLGRKLNPNQITVAIFCDPSQPSSCHIEKIIPVLSRQHNVVLFGPGNQNLIENYGQYCCKIYIFKANQSPFSTPFACVKALKQLPFLQYVLIDQTTSRHFLKTLWQNAIASILFLNKDRATHTANLNKQLQFATRVVYDSVGTYNHVLTYILWAKPDQIDYLALPVSDNVEMAANTVAEIGVAACAQMAREEQDSQYLADHSAFDCQYYSGKMRKPKARREDAKKYIRFYKSGAVAARPAAGIHPGLYAQSHDLGFDRADPFVHYLQNNKPHGIWCWNVITQATPLSQNLCHARIALHIHAYYPEMLHDILSAMMKNKIRPDIFISVKSEQDKAFAEKITAQYIYKSIIRIVPNRGRDIGPLLTEFGRELTTQYDYIGHLHTKQSKHLKNPKRVEKWNHFLMMNLLGNEQRPMADTILSTMADHPNIALVFPDDKYAVGWAQNYPAGLDVAHKLGIQHLSDFTIFPVGTMFWAQPAALKPFVDLHIQWNDYPVEPLANDGTMLHAIERLLALSCFNQGLDIATTYLEDIQR